MPNPFDLSGKQALVTGANTGLGQGMAVALAEAGADIVAVGRSPADETRYAVEAAGRRFTDIRSDLLDKSAVREVVARAEKEAGPSDILVNNAGIIRRSDALDFDERDWDDVMNVNIRALFFLSQDFSASVVKRNVHGKIINVASMLSYQGGIRVASYTASKSGIMGLTRLLANEWAGRQINVNAIAPGYFATNNTAALQADEDRNRQILERIPAGRWGAPGDLGGGVVFLASAASDYVHGITLPIDGGWLAR
ncbi:MAG: 2-dehydro-3-deoxy-D-gluconate 5-dehydrogenase KduD [Pseudomonadota bacterium]